MWTIIPPKTDDSFTCLTLMVHTKSFYAKGGKKKKKCTVPPNVVLKQISQQIAKTAPRYNLRAKFGTPACQSHLVTQ